MNWGGFAGGFSQGFNSSIQMAKTFKDLRKQNAIEDVRAQSLAEVNAAYDADVQSRIKDNSQVQQAASAGVSGRPAEQVTAPSGQPTDSIIQNPEQATGATVIPATAPTRFKSLEPKPQDEDRPIAIQRAREEPTRMAAEAPAQSAATPIVKTIAGGLPFVVGDKSYATREEATIAAKKSAPDKTHFFSRIAVPRIQEKMIELGDIDAADKLGKWAEDRENQEYARNWMKLDLATRSGDFKNAAKQFVSLYKKFDDGVELVGDPEEIKNEGGDITGFKVNLKNTEGKEYSMVVTPQDILTRGAAMLSPIEKFKLDYAKQQSADEAVAKGKAEMAKEERALLVDNYKAERNNRYQSQRDVRQQGDLIERMTLQQQLQEAGASQRVQREVGAKVDLLRSAGRSEQFINEVLPELLGVGSYKKALSPEDAKLKIRGELMANDRDFQRMTEAQRQAQVNEVMKFVYGGTATPRAQGTTTTPQGSPPVWRP